VELAEVLTDIEPIVKAVDGKVKTERWTYEGKRFRKIILIWIVKQDDDG